MVNFAFRYNQVFMRGEVVSSILAGCKFKWLNNSNILIIGIHVRLLVNMTVSHTMWWRLEIMFYYCDLGGDHCKLMPLIANLGIYLQSRCRLQCLAMPSQHFRHYDSCKAFRNFPTLLPSFLKGFRVQSPGLWDSDPKIGH